MSASGTASRLVIACFLLLGVAGHPQAQQGPQQAQPKPQQTQQSQQTKPFQPEVGQPGKDVMYLATVQPLVEKMLDMAQVTPRDYVIDLGSGDGRTVIAAARRGARALGIEYNPDLVALSKANAANARVGAKATFKQADIFATDFSHATVITMFLLPAINMKLRPTILAMKPGTRIVSNSFGMEDWMPDATAKVPECAESDEADHCTALLWIVPAKAEGGWQLGSGELTGELTLKQHFQELSGTLTVSGTLTESRSTPISDAKMRGDKITFSAGNTVYTGRLNGNQMKGTSTTSGRTAPWTATRR